MCNHFFTRGKMTMWCKNVSPSK